MKFVIDTQTDSLEDIQKIITILQKHIEDHQRYIFFNPIDEEFAERRTENKEIPVSQIKKELDSQIELHQEEQKMPIVKPKANITNKKISESIINQKNTPSQPIENETIPHTINSAHNRDPRQSEGSAPSFKKFLGLVKQSKEQELQNSQEYNQ